MRGPHQGSAALVRKAHDLVARPGVGSLRRWRRLEEEHDAHEEIDMMIASGDVLICTEELDENVGAGAIVIADDVRCDGGYVTLEGNPGCAYHGSAFVVAVRRPWWAWADEAGWRAQAFAVARERLADMDPDTLRNLMSETLVARSAAEVAHLA